MFSGFTNSQTVSYQEVNFGIFNETWPSRRIDHLQRHWLGTSLSSVGFRISTP